MSHLSDSDLSVATKPWIALQESIQAEGSDQAAASCFFEDLSDLSVNVNFIKFLQMLGTLHGVIHVRNAPGIMSDITNL